MYFEHPIEWPDDKVSRLWDYYSRTPPYSEVYFSKLFGANILKKSGLPITQDIEILDFGCGPGFLWDHACNLQAKWNYSALDFSPDSVAKVIKKGVGHPNFKGAYSVTEMPTSLPSEYFDAVLLIEVVEHLTDAHLHGTLSEITRLLKPGGVVVISTPNNEDMAASTRFCPDCGAIFHQWQHVRSWDLNSLSMVLRQYGFEIVRYEVLDFCAQGLFRQLLRFVKKFLRGNFYSPHMIATFQKR